MLDRQDLGIDREDGLIRVNTFNRFHYPLNLLCSQSALDDGFDLFLNYDARCFDGSEARDLLNRYLSILDTLAGNIKEEIRPYGFP